MLAYYVEWYMRQPPVWRDRGANRASIGAMVTGEMMVEWTKSRSESKQRRQEIGRFKVIGAQAL